MSLQIVLRAIIRVRLQVSPNSEFSEQLKELEVELSGQESLEVEELPRKQIDHLALLKSGGSSLDIVNEVR